jgi:CRISPR-associated endonuclease/helicase Cas3
MELEQLLLAHKPGLHRSEIARRLGVHRSTASRYVDELSRSLPILEDNEGQVGINRNGYLNNIRLTIHESLALFLACRLMTDRTDRFNPHAAAALRKLGSSLKAFSPTIAAQIISEADRFDSSRVRRDPVYLNVIEALTRGWSEGKLVKLVHHSIHSNEDRAYAFAVYLIVPYAVGQSVQAIGKCQGDDHLRTFRIDRIVRAELTEESFQVPLDLNLGKLLGAAWGIWYTDAEPVDVVLRFSANVAYRVRESVWHISQELTDLPNGELIWRAQIAEPREMFPWIRGWGVDVEVIAPAELRQRITDEVRAMAVLYTEIK